MVHKEIVERNEQNAMNTWYIMCCELMYIVILFGQR